MSRGAASLSSVAVYLRFAPSEVFTPGEHLSLRLLAVVVGLVVAAVAGVALYLLTRKKRIR